MAGKRNRRNRRGGGGGAPHQAGASQQPDDNDSDDGGVMSPPLTAASVPGQTPDEPSGSAAAATPTDAVADGMPAASEAASELDPTAAPTDGPAGETAASNPAAEAADEAKSVKAAATEDLLGEEATPAAEAPAANAAPARASATTAAALPRVVTALAPAISSDSARTPKTPLAMLLASAGRSNSKVSLHTSGAIDGEADLVDVAEVQTVYEHLISTSNKALQTTPALLTAATTELIQAVMQLLQLSSHLSDIASQLDGGRSAVDAAADAVRDRLREVVAFVRATPASPEDQFEELMDRLRPIVSSITKATGQLYEHMRSSANVQAKAVSKVVADQAASEHGHAMSASGTSSATLPPVITGAEVWSDSDALDRALLTPASSDSHSSELGNLYEVAHALVQENRELKDQREMLLAKLEATDSALTEASHTIDVLNLRVEALSAMSESIPNSVEHEMLLAEVDRLIKENEDLKDHMNEIDHRSEQKDELLAEAKAASERSESAWADERGKLLAELAELRAAASAERGALPEQVAGKDDEIARLRQQLLAESAARADAERQLDELKSKPVTPAPLSRGDSGMSLGDKEKKQLSTEIELLRLANMRLEVSRNKILKALNQEDMDKLQAATATDCRRLIVKASPASGLSGILAFCHKRIAEAKEQLAELAAPEAQAEVKVLISYFERVVADVEPYHKQIALVEQQVVDAHESARRSERAVQTLRADVEKKERQIAELVQQTDSLRDEVDEWHAQADAKDLRLEKLQSEHAEQRTANNDLRARVAAAELRIEELQGELELAREELAEWCTAAETLKSHKAILEAEVAEARRIGVHARDVLELLRSAVGDDKLPTQAVALAPLLAESVAPLRSSSSFGSITMLNDPPMRSTSSSSSIALQQPPLMDPNIAASRIQRAVRRHLRRKSALEHDIVRRRHIVSEILDTETSYVGHLQVLVDNYRETFRKKVGAVISKEQFEAIFYETGEILEFNKRLLASIQERVDKWHAEQAVGEIFVAVGAQLDTYYTNYVNNYNRALAALNECRARESFRAIMAEIKEKQGRRSLALPDLLIMPIQRVVRYSLLLQELLKRTSTSHPDYEQLSHAVDVIKAAAETINEKKGQVEKFQAVIDLQSRLNGFPRSMEPLVRGQDRFVVKEGDLCEMVSGSPKERRVFLFNDLVLCTKLANKYNPASEYEFKWAYALTALNDVSAKGDQETYNRDGANMPLLPIVMTFQGDKGLEKRTLYAFSETERSNWVNELDKRSTPTISIVASPGAAEPDKAEKLTGAQRLGSVFRRKDTARVMSAAGFSKRGSTDVTAHAREGIAASRKLIDDWSKQLAGQVKVHSGIEMMLERMNADSSGKRANQKARERLMQEIVESNKRMQALQKQIAQEEQAIEEMEKFLPSESTNSSSSSLSSLTSLHTGPLTPASPGAATPPPPGSS